MKKKTSVLSILSSSTLQSNVILPSIRETYDYLAKIIIIGASGTGKTCLLKKFLNFDIDQKALTNNARQTIGVEFHSKVLELPGKVNFKLQLWDTAGQERFKSITSSYYRGSAGVILCFDLTREDTLVQLESDLSDVKVLCNAWIISCVIVGNKKDLVDAVSITEAQLQEFVKAMRLKYEIDIDYIYDCSSISGENVYEVFELISLKIHDKIQQGIIDIRDSTCGVQLRTEQIIHSDSNMNLEIIGRRDESTQNRYSCC